MADPIILAVYYFAPITYYAHWLQADEVCLEAVDHYEKQTYRNRCYIYNANSKLMLNIPIKHKRGMRKYKDVHISYEYPWQEQHQKSLKIAYQSSSYYEYYEDDFLSLFQSKEIFLWDLNWKFTHLISMLIESNLLNKCTEVYQKNYPNKTDLRDQFHAKKHSTENLQLYHQVFSEKHGFLSDLSIVDLLFHQGKNGIKYLKNLPLIS
ncbi:MAG: WbqC family protein [Flavobacteriales bacterium AspAUS03]